MTTKKPKTNRRFIAFSGPNIAQTWKEVVGSFRVPPSGHWTIYEITPLYAGESEYLAELPDPDAPVIEVVRDGDCYVISCGEYGWDGDRWNTGGHGDYWHFDCELDAMKIAALLRKHKDFPPVDGGAQ